MGIRPWDSLHLKTDLTDLQLHTLMPMFLTYLESFLEMRSKENVKRFQKPAPGLDCPGQQGRECDKVIWEFCLKSFVKFYFNVFLCSSAKEILGMPNCFNNQELDQASEWQVATKLNATCLCKLVKQYLARGCAASLGTVQSREGLLPARNLCWDGETEVQIE